MSIRLWLMMADCWSCGTTIELTEAQEQEARRLLRDQEETRQKEGEEAAVAIRPRVARTPVPTAPAKPAPAPQPEPKPEPVPAEVPERKEAAPRPAEPESGAKRVSAAQARAQRRIRELAARSGAGIYWRELLRNMPAWLVSLIVHLVGMLLLALWYDPNPEPPSITLSTAVSDLDLPGELGDIAPVAIEPIDFSDPGAIDAATLKTLQSAPTDVVVDTPLDAMVAHPPDSLSSLPDASRLNENLIPAPAGPMFAGRDPDARAQLVRQSGGTTATEAAVTRGLEWLARAQNDDGSWSLDKYGGGESDTAGTALGLLPFLGAGQTHLVGDYRSTVFKGLKWLVERQGDDGDLRGPGIGQMYAHGQAAIVLCEALALTGDDQLRPPAQLAVNFILEAQHDAGGWRYQPKQAGDTSVVGWQLMALRSAQMCYLHVPQEAFVRAGKFLDSVQQDRYGGRYAYQPGNPASATMTAEALLCRQYQGWLQDHRGLQDGATYLVEENLPHRSDPNIYFWYYATQVLHHLGGRRWDTWNRAMRGALVDMQETEGDLAGSWDPAGPFAASGGRIYMTSLAVCTLEVYYRHLPLYTSEVLLGPK